MKVRSTKVEAEVQTASMNLAEMDAGLADIGADLDRLIEQVAHLGTKAFYLAVTGTQTALLAGVILFSEKLKALIGLY
jgi:hypothetical protein